VIGPFRRVVDIFEVVVTLLLGGAALALGRCGLVRPGRIAIQEKLDGKVVNWMDASLTNNIS
jgi:hypothetical protein